MKQSTLIPDVYIQAYALAWNAVMELNMRGQYASLISVEFDFVRQEATAVMSSNGERRTVVYTIGANEDGLFAPTVKRIN